MAEVTLLTRGSARGSRNGQFWTGGETWHYQKSWKHIFLVKFDKNEQKVKVLGLTSEKFNCSIPSSSHQFICKDVSVVLEGERGSELVMAPKNFFLGT